MGIPCYTTGTRIDTARGPVPIEEITAGDLIVTDTGDLTPVVWIGRTYVSQDMMRQRPELVPVRIKAGACGNRKALVVSQQHCMVMEHEGESVFVRARHLAEETKAAHFARGRTEVTYHHMLLSAHSVVRVEGALSESFYPGQQILKTLAPLVRASLEASVARINGVSLTGYGPRALPVLGRSSLRKALNRGEAPKPASPAQNTLKKVGKQR
ncbi:MAG: Hint domain-containing protein [Roseobacter sp.]|nr:Hint domain-containing protein [Roseobacter sp.]